MRWNPAPLLFASMAAVAAVPYSFPSGVPAKASQVNRNFEALDSLVTAQIEQLSDLRDRLTASVEGLRRDLDSLQARAGQSIAPAQPQTPAPIATPAPATLSPALPVGTVLAMITAPGPDGFLPGSNGTWQVIESFGGVQGMPAASAPQPVPTPEPVVAPQPKADLTAAPAAAAPDSTVSATLDSSAVPSDTTAATSAPAASPASDSTAVPVAQAASVAPVPAPASAAAKPRPVLRWYVKVK